VNKRILFLSLMIALAGLLVLPATPALAQSANVWKAESLPQQSHITGGPWTLQQRGSEQMWGRGYVFKISCSKAVSRTTRTTSF